MQSWPCGQGDDAGISQAIAPEDEPAQGSGAVGKMAASLAEEVGAGQVQAAQPAQVRRCEQGPEATVGQRLQAEVETGQPAEPGLAGEGLRTSGAEMPVAEAH